MHKNRPARSVGSRERGGSFAGRTKVMTESVESSEDLAKASVELTCNEEELVSILVEAAEAYGTMVRICGGWVRDKALGRVTKDIDVAVDNCTGAVFAERVSHVLAARARRSGDDQSAREPFSRVGVIAANPEQSKHLETATMRLCDVEVDFVNLRSESYADGSSRVPTSVAIGTPKEDALRRDFTLNALFFNAHTRTIEDWTGRGWSDLRAGLLRTPLDPRVTLLDDPLRALRGVRFAARYDFRLDEPLRAACADPEVRNALLTKVSRERIGKELRGALASKASGAARAVDELRRLNLASATLRVPEAKKFSGEARGTAGVKVPISNVYDDCSDPESPIWHLAARCVAAHASLAFPDNNLDLYQRDELNGWLASLALALSPLADCKVFSKKNKPASLPAAVCRDGLKLPTRDVDAAQALIDSSETCRQLVDRWHDIATNGRPPQALAEFRRDAGNLLFDLKEKWRAAFAVARARDVANIDHAWLQLEAHHPTLEPTAAAELNDKYRVVLAAINDDLHLDHVWTSLKPFFDGSQLIAELNIPKGPQVGRLIRAQKDFQLMHPDADQHACKVYLRNYLDTRRGTQEAAGSKKRRT